MRSHCVGVLARAAQEGGAYCLCTAALACISPGEGVSAQLQLLRALEQKHAAQQRYATRLLRTLTGHLLC